MSELVELRKDGGWTRRFVGTKEMAQDKYLEENYPDGSPSCTHTDGSYEYRTNGVLHREGGPASEFFWEDNGVKQKDYAEYRQTGQLHRVDGPAIESPLQDDIYSFFGQNINPEWTKPGGLTSEAILKEENAEKRRAGVEVYGIDKFVEETTKTIVEADISNRNDTRALVILKDDTRWFICTDGSTGRVYHIKVPDETQTCAEGYKLLTSLDDDKCVASG